MQEDVEKLYNHDLGLVGDGMLACEILGRCDDPDVPCLTAKVFGQELCVEQVHMLQEFLDTFCEISSYHEGFRARHAKQ